MKKRLYILLPSAILIGIMIYFGIYENSYERVQVSPEQQDNLNKIIIDIIDQYNGDSSPEYGDSSGVDFEREPVGARYPTEEEVNSVGAEGYGVFKNKLSGTYFVEILCEQSTSKWSMDLLYMQIQLSQAEDDNNLFDVEAVRFPDGINTDSIHVKLHKTNSTPDA